MFAVAIDGPSGAGKSTIARAVAQKLGFLYIDTGAMYRTLGLYLLENSVDRKDEPAVKAVLPDVKIELEICESGQRMYLNGRDVTELIRSPEVSMAASDCSSLPAVREFLLGMQRELAEKNHVLMDGRDIGTVVLPHAQLKIFLTASPEERARRRVEQLSLSGRTVDYHTTLKEIKERDLQDSTRAAAPLKPAEDAVMLDTTGNTFEQSVECILKLVREAAEKAEK